MDWENETINFACLGLEEIRALQCGVDMIPDDAVSDDIRAEIDLATKEPDYHETGQGKLQRMERICGGVDFPTGKLPELLPVADAVLASKGIANFSSYSKKVGGVILIGVGIYLFTYLL